MKTIKLIAILLMLSVVAYAAPVISNLAITATTATTATVSWTTNTASSSQVLYGIGNLVNNTPVDGTLVTSHSVVVNGLVAGVLYSYAAISDDGAPTQSSTQQFQLCTAGGMTRVSGTINNFYEYGQYTINWLNTSGQAVSPTICGQSLTQSYSGTMDGSGSFTTTLGDVNQIVPSPSTWTFGFKSFGNAIGAISTNIGITGNSQDVSSPIQTAAINNLQHVFYDPTTLAFYPSIAGTGTVTSVGLAGPTGIVISNSPVTSGGTLTWAMPNGWTTGDLLLGNGSNSVARLAKGGNGTFLGVSGGAVGWFTPATGASTFDQIGSGTNSTATMLCGTGCSLGPAGSGSLTANVFSGILPAANGGTANGFFAVTGPTTSTKTFTFPNANATILTTNAAVTVGQGGTSATTFTTHGTLIGEGTSAIVAISPGSSGQALISAGSVADPAYGILGIGGGGTGASTQQTAATALLPTATRAGDVLYWDGTNWNHLAGNNSGTQFLQETSSGVPSWATPSGTGTVTGPGTSVVGHLASWNDTLGSVLADTGIAATSTATASGTLTSGQLLAGAGTKAIQTTNLSGDATTSGTAAVTVIKVNGVAYGTSPATNTIPVVTGANTVTYETAPIAAGGTGATTQTTAFNALAPTPTRAGDLIYYNGTNWVNLAGNNSGSQFLTENASGVPSWSTSSSTPCTTTANSIQYNNGGSFGCTSTFTWNGTSNVPSLAVGAITTDINPLAITWTNNASGTTFNGIKWTLTDTASGASSQVFQIIGGTTGTTSLSALDKSGNLTVGGSITTGPNGGVGGTLTVPEGTTASASAGNDVCYGDSTLHGIKCSYNNGSFLNLPLETGTMTSGNLVSVNSTTNLLQDAGIAVANAVTASGTLTSGLVALGNGSKTLTTSANLAFSGATLTIGASGSSGNAAIVGSSSGTITIQPQAAAGTYNFNLPTTAGSSGQPLLSGGGGATAMAFGTLGVGGGGTGLTSGTSGGVLGFTASGTLASSAALTQNGVVIGGGAGATPTTTSAGTTGTVFIGTTSSAPSFTATPTLGVAGTTAGTLALAGLTSNGATLKSQSVGGQLTIELPNTAPTANQVMYASAVVGNTVTLGFTSGAGGSGTVNSGTAGQLTYYASTGTAVNGNANLTISGSTLTLGVTSSATGAAVFSGGSGGAVTIQPQATAGTYNFNLPTTAGSSGQPLLSGGGGASPMTFGTLGVGGGGTGLTSGTSGGVLGFTATGTLASSGALTQNALVLGGGAGATPTIASGLTTDGTSKITLGVSGTSVGATVFNNATTGSITLQPVTGALSSSVLSLPARTANIATNTGTLTNGDICSFDSSGNCNDASIAAANLATAGSSAGAAKQVAISAGANKALSFITFPATPEYAPAANNVNGTAGIAWNCPNSTPVALLRAGTNNKGALLSPWGSSDSCFIQFHIPADADLTSQLPTLMLELTSTDATNGHTVIMQESVACAKEDGSTTDDVAYNAARSFATITLNGNANRVWDTTITLNSTDLTGCAAPGIMWVKVSRTTDTATNVGVYGLDFQPYRLLTVQAN